MLLGTACEVRPEAKLLTEWEKIEVLISSIEKMKGATFIRNGSAYNSETAANFLRTKWHARDKELKTAKEFIAQAASVSSISGEPYLIRYVDGSEVTCGDYLTAQLRKLNLRAP